MKYTTSLFCEFDKYAAESYCAVHDTAPELNIGDITKADEKSVPDFNTMFGGSPCQDFSIAGKQGGAAWTCRNCGHTYNPLEAHYTERDKCPNCGSTKIVLVSGVHDPVLSGATNRFLSENRKPIDRIS